MSITDRTPSRPTRTRRLLRRLAWVAAGLVTLGVLGYALENFRGARALRKAVAEVEAAGGSLDPRQLCPEPVPDAENFVALPILRDIALPGEAGEEARNRFAPLADLVRQHDDELPQWSETSGQPIDLAAWRAFLGRRTDLPPPAGNPSREILASLAVHDAEFFDPLAAGLLRPQSQFLPPLREQLGTGNLFALARPHLRTSIDLVRVCQLRASAAAHAGDAALFLESLAIARRLIEAHAAEPLLIDFLVALTEMEMVTSVIWDALHLRLLDEDPLADLQRWLADRDPLSGYPQCLQTELAMAVSTFAWLKEEGSARRLTELSAVGPAPSLMERAFASLVGTLPAGWWDQNAAALIRWMHRDVILPLRSGDATAVRTSVARVEKALRDAPAPHPYLVMARMVFPDQTNFIERVGAAQARRHQALLACALERHRLARGTYPETLEALVPGFVDRLPIDFLSGQPPEYVRSENGRYRLDLAGTEEDKEPAWFYPAAIAAP